MTGSDAAHAGHPAALDGIWGGIQIVLTMAPSGGHLQMACAEGSIIGPIKMRRDGSFSAKGSYQEFGGGPQRADDSAPAPKARFSGTVHDGAMTLTILPAGSKAPQTHQLRKGARSKLIRCL